MLKIFVRKRDRRERNARIREAERDSSNVSIVTKPTALTNSRH